MSIGDAWKSKDFRKLREKHLSKKLNNTLCDNCWNNKCEKFNHSIGSLVQKLMKLSMEKKLKKSFQKIQFSKF